MKVIDKEKFQDALSIVNPGLSTKEIIDQSSNFIFANGRVAAYNDEIHISYPLEWIDFSATVPGKKLIEILTKMESTRISFEMKENELILKEKNFVANIKVQTEVKNYFDIENIKFCPVPDDFSKAIGLCLFSTGRAMVQPVLMCVHIKHDVVESCDNFRIMQVRLSERLEEDFLLQLNSAEEVSKYNIVRYALVNNWAHFIAKEGFSISCRIQNGEYPEISNLFEIKKYHNISFPRALPDMLNRASVTLTKEQPHVQVNIENGILTVFGENDMIRTKEISRIKCETEKPINFFINPVFLQQILSTMDETQLADDMSKLKFTGKNYQHIIGL